MWVMKRDDGIVVVRTEPGHLQGNLANNVHGGAILTQVDIALFVCARLHGCLRHGPAVTLDLQSHFIGAGRVGLPLDAEVELLKETGRMLFLRGLVKQQDASICSFYRHHPQDACAQNARSANMTGTLARYDALVTGGELRPDADQRAAAVRLQAMQDALEAVPPRGSLLWRLMAIKPRPDPVRGLYMFGGVGRGKSMLMDLFYDAVTIDTKVRVHFHEFMQDIHARLRVERDKMQGDPIPPVARQFTDNYRLIAFDEMVVNNSADAMIMSRLFTAIIEAGVTVVATSNRPPDDLYKDGLNREHFLPFIALIKQRLDVQSLNGPTDYRLESACRAPTPGTFPTAQKPPLRCAKRSSA